MPNYCDYDMKIVGHKDNIKELIQIMQYKHPNYTMYRIFDADVYDEEDNAVYVSGDVAWSILSTMISPPPNRTTIIDQSKRLNLDVEIFSTEPGIGFQEHFIIKRGTIVVNECMEYLEYHFDPSEYNADTYEEKFQMFCDEYYLNIKQEQLNEDSNYIVGKEIENYCCWSI